MIRIIRAVFFIIISSITLLAVTGQAHSNTVSRVLSIDAGGDLQAALAAARPGDVIEIEAGTTVTGNFSLPNKESGGSAGWITIRSSAPDESLLPEGTRVTPESSAVLARLVSPNALPVLRTEPGAHHYRFIGIEFTIAPDVMLNYGIVRLGDGDEAELGLLPHDIVLDRCYIHGHALADVSRGVALNSASTEIVNSYISDIHGIGFDTQAICGWNGPGPFKIVNNYLEAAGENVLIGGADPKIAGLVPSDIEFRRNDCVKPLVWKEGIIARPTELNAAAEFSAAGALTPGATYYYRVAARGRAGYSAVATSSASDEIAVTTGTDQNTVSLAWKAVEYASEYRVFRTSDGPESESRAWVGYTCDTASFMDTADPQGVVDAQPPEGATRWSVKNIFELKNARRVRIDGNLFENNWVDAQSGFAILFTVRNQDGAAPWSVIEDVEFTNNVLRHSAAAINIFGRDNNHPSEQAKRIEIKNNLFYDIGGSEWGGNGRFLQITESLSVSVVNNTVIHTGNIITAFGEPNKDFVFTNNLVPNNDYGIIGEDSASGTDTIEQYLPASTFKKNAIVGGKSVFYPVNNFFPATFDEVGFLDLAAGNYRLSTTSPYKEAGTRRKDVGANIDKIESARN